MDWLVNLEVVHLAETQDMGLAGAFESASLVAYRELVWEMCPNYLLAVEVVSQALLDWFDKQGG